MCRYILLKLNLFLISKPKVVYLHPFLSSLTFPKFWKQNFMYFGHKHVQVFLTETSGHGIGQINRFVDSNRF